MTFGIDHASVDANKPPDLAAAKAAGLRFVFIRASYANWSDPTCARDRDAVRAAGLIFGAYMFPVMGKDHPSPEDQVTVALRSAQLLPHKDFPLVLDIEFPKGIAGTGLTRPEVAAWISRARAEAVKQTGVDPIIYSSDRVLDGTDADALAGTADSAVRGCPAWLARYPYKTRIPAVIDDATVSRLARPPVPKAFGDADAYFFHQYQGDALKLPGFSATVDMDRFNLLHFGTRGTRVAWTQRRAGAVEGVTGLWDAALDYAVRSFQTEHGLDADGVIGPATFAALAWVPVR